MITVFSDGSHLASVDKAVPTMTRGAVIIYQDGELVNQYTRLGRAGWSDIAEYEAILLGLEKLKDLKLRQERIEWYGDNKFVMNYMQKRYAGKANKAYYALSTQCVKLAQEFKFLTFKWIPREQNTTADALSKLHG